MNNFRTIVNIPLSKEKIEHENKIMLIGSCFTENIGKKLAADYFSLNINPFGIVFNPYSIYEQLKLITANQIINADNLFYHNELWHHHLFHSKYSGINKHEVISTLNHQITEAHNFLKNADLLIITLGTAKVYSHILSEKIYANCHKLPNNQFSSKLFNSIQVDSYLQECINVILKFNQNIKLIFTISPIRHWADGAILNQLSKSVLIEAVHQIISRNKNIHYFPAYEIMMDDLRDYRFYENDMLHPSNLAIEYIWEKFCNTYFSNNTFEITEKLRKINKAVNHLPFNPQSTAYKEFIKDQLKDITILKQKYPYLDLTNLVNELNNKSHYL